MHFGQTKCRIFASIKKLIKYKRKYTKNTENKIYKMSTAIMQSKIWKTTKKTQQYQWPHNSQQPIISILK